MWRFEDPWMLLLLCILPFVLLQTGKRERAALLFSDLAPLQEVTGNQGAPYRMILRLLRGTALTLLILALARPQTVEGTHPVATHGIDIILCLDTSGSMRALDFTLNGKRVDRLTVVKKVVSRFIRRREHDRIGMVVFAGNAYTQCPLTLDYGILTQLLDRVEIGMAGDGTAIGSALAVSVKRLKNSKAKSRVVILLTDGRNNTGTIDPETAAKIAGRFGIRVYTIGAGTRGPAPFLVRSFFGERLVYQNVDLDETTLKKIAKITKGAYFRATDTKGLEEIYRRIDRLEKTRIPVREYREYTERFPLFLVPGMLLLGVEILLGNTLLRKIP